MSREITPTVISFGIQIAVTDRQPQYVDPSNYCSDQLLEVNQPIAYQRLLMPKPDAKSITENIRRAWEQGSDTAILFASSPHDDRIDKISSIARIAGYDEPKLQEDGSFAIDLFFGIDPELFD